MSLACGYDACLGHGVGIADLFLLVCQSEDLGTVCQKPWQAHRSP